MCWLRTILGMNENLMQQAANIDQRGTTFITNLGVPHPMFKQRAHRHWKLCHLIREQFQARPDRRLREPLKEEMQNLGKGLWAQEEKELVQALSP